MDPDEPFDAAAYMALGRQVVTEIIRRGKTPVVVGGTGLYIKALYTAFSAPMRATPLYARGCAPRRRLWVPPPCTPGFSNAIRRPPPGCTRTTRSVFCGRWRSLK